MRAGPPYPSTSKWTRRLGAVTCFGMLVLALSCSGSSGEPLNSTTADGPIDVPPWSCVPGETQPCDCPDELDGVRTCNAEGSAFSECDCSPAAVSQGPPPTGGGTDTGTGTGGSGTDTMGTTAADSTSDDGPGNTTEPDPTTGMGESSSSGPGGGESSSSDGGGGSSSSSSGT